MDMKEGKNVRILPSYRPSLIDYIPDFAFWNPIIDAYTYQKRHHTTSDTESSVNIGG